MRSVAIVVCAVLLSGCSSTYAPRNRVGLYTVMRGGQIAYVRPDGMTYDFGFAGGGLADAVRDNPRALDAAETFRDRNLGGLAMVLAGVLCPLATLPMIAREEATDDDAAIYATTSLLCMTGLMLGGAALLASGQPYQYDAINMWNDDFQAAP